MKGKAVRNAAREPLADRIGKLINISPKSQNEIADEIGYEKANIITMFKKGTTKVPIGRVGPLATALGADPAQLVRHALMEYLPETYDAIEKYLGGVLTQNELAVVEAFREATNFEDPDLTSAKLARIREACAG
tara:strand:- start:1439 stop:1840 length:402 start_codon:yes stop_codon:yes gene_type:complete